MREHEKPDWQRGDTLRNIKEIVVIGSLALVECMKDGVAWVDTRLADRINGADDE